jgi:hypothetical protein
MDSTVKTLSPGNSVVERVLAAMKTLTHSRKRNTYHPKQKDEFFKLYIFKLLMFLSEINGKELPR